MDKATIPKKFKFHSVTQWKIPWVPEEFSCSFWFLLGLYNNHLAACSFGRRSVGQHWNIPTHTKEKNLPVPRVMEKQNIDNMFRCSQRSHHRIFVYRLKSCNHLSRIHFFTQGMKGLTLTNVMLHCSLTLLWKQSDQQQESIQIALCH